MIKPKFDDEWISWRDRGGECVYLSGIILEYNNGIINILDELMWEKYKKFIE